MCLIAVSNSWLLAGGCCEAIFSVLNNIGNIPQAFILSLQLREAEVTDVERERDTGPPWHCHSHSICRICWCQCVPVAGTGLTAMLNKSPTKSPPQQLSESQVCLGSGTWPQESGCTNKPSSMRANKGFPSLWMQTPSTCFIHSKLC